MFAMRLDQFTSYKWILNTSVSFVISLFFSPLAKVVLVNILLDYIVQKFKDFRNKRKQMAYVVPCEQSTG